MVSFLSKVANYYVRDPRVQGQQSSPFYDSYYGGSTSPGYVYNPNALDPNNPSVGVPANASVSRRVPANNSFLPSVGGYGNGSFSIPGLSNFTGYSDTGILGASNPISKLLNPILGDTALTRLANNNLPAGADYSTLYNPSDGYSNISFNDGEESRVMVSDPSGKLISGSITAPLADTSGVIFPYTPTISIAHRANYDSDQLVHTNYDHLYYKNSNVDSIGLQTKFTANTPDEAAYVLAALHFFRSATKMFYGQDSIAGTPPPVLRLDGYGHQMLDHLPVVCTSFDYSFPEDVDYISANSITSSGSGTGGVNKVPTMMNFNLTFKLVYSRQNLSTQFGLERFASGQLLTNSKPGQGGPGGYI
jgi:hypothetical protein